MEPKKEQSCLEWLLTLIMGYFVAIGSMGGMLYILEKMGFTLKW